MQCMTKEVVCYNIGKQENNQIYCAHSRLTGLDGLCDTHMMTTTHSFLMGNVSWSMMLKLNAIFFFFFFLVGSTALCGPSPP
jgi:hypothetical protein